MKNGIYVVSKIRHAEVWRGLRDRGYPIISTWIDDGLEAEIDFTEAWPRYLNEASKASFVIAYAEPGDVLKGGVFEMGAALANGAYVFVVGIEHIPAARTVRSHPRLRPATSVNHAIALIENITGAVTGSRKQNDVGHWVERTFGSEVLFSMHERGKRVFEEAAELCQTFNIPVEKLHEIVDYVYARPVGETNQEIAGVGVTLLALAYAWGVSLDDVVDEEIDRIHKLPADHFRKKHSAKAAAGISLVPHTVNA